MYELQTKSGDLKARFWIPPEQVEPSAMQQVRQMADHPFLHKWVAIMPDVHVGIGATIGAVLPMDGVLIPAAVGVDIGCGMCAVKTDLDYTELKPHLPHIHNLIIDRIPLGFDHRRSDQMDDVYRYCPPDFLKRAETYGSYGSRHTLPQLGSLGGGNHFIELQTDESKAVWIMVHSGSRNIGNLLATNHMKIARKTCRQLKLQCPPSLEYLREDSDEGKRYIDDMQFAMEFARQNRFVMLGIIKSILTELFNKVSFDSTINIHHNYAAREKHFGRNLWVHRKGATRVRDDIVGIIPGSMAAPSYIVTGTNNAESFNSCSHGAGRTMSRRQAKTVIDLESFREKMTGIYSQSVDKRHLDEAPDAYKDISQVIDRQNDLIKVKVKLMPVFNIKG